MSYTQIAYAVQGAIARIDHARPEHRNAESSVLLDEMDAALAEAVKNPDVRVIIIGGQGPHFSAGHDLKEGQAKRANFTVEERYAYEELRYLDYCLRLWDCPKPTIASVRGAAIAGGFMVANMCDLIVAADDAFFADPVLRTLGAAAVEVLIHPWVMGLRTAKDFLFTGRRMYAEEAHRIGMVNRVVPVADLDAETMKLAEEIASVPPFAIKMTKRSLNRALDIQGFRNSLMAHFDTHELSHVSQEFQAARDRGLASAIKAGRNG
jgi:enoyl-CoA hydratase